MHNGYTHISVILDQTGSMESIRDDTIGGFNAFPAEQKKQPGKVVVPVVTDGQENSRCEFNRQQVDKMIKRQTEKDDWQFVFLTADLGAVDDARSVGIGPDAILAFAKDKTGTAAAWSSLSSTTSGYRTGPKKRKIGFVQRDRDMAGDSKKSKK